MESTKQCDELIVAHRNYSLILEEWPDKRDDVSLRNSALEPSTEVRRFGLEKVRFLLLRVLGASLTLVNLLLLCWVIGLKSDSNSAPDTIPSRNSDWEKGIDAQLHNVSEVLTFLLSSVRRPSPSDVAQNSTAPISESLDTHRVGSRFPAKLRVIADKANLRSGPSEVSNIVMTVGAGTDLLSIGESGEWYQVYAPNGQVLHVANSVVEALSE